MKITDVNREELTNVIKQFYDVKINNLDKIVLFQLGDFYEMFFEDAIEVAQLFELTLTKKSAGLSEKIPMAGVPLSTLDNYVARLMKLNKQVVVVKQDETTSLGKKIVDRKIAKIITPGTFQDVNTKENNFLAAIAQNQTVAISYGDNSTGEMYNTEFINVDEAFNHILTLGVKEIVDYENNLDEYLELASMMGVTVINNFEATISNSDAITVANEILIDYFKFVTCDNIAHLHDFKTIARENYLAMSIQTQKQLELVETLKDQEYQGSLYWFLNKTNTAMGRRLLKQMIIHPLLNEKEIIKRHDTIDMMIKNSLITEEISEVLSSIYDFERLIGRLSDGQINPKEMEQLKKSVNNIPKLKQTLYSFNNQIAQELADQIDELTDVSKTLNDILIEEPSMLIKEGNIIKVGYNEEVDKLRDIKRNSNKWLSNFEMKEREKTGIKNLKIKYNKIFGYFIEVTNSFLNLVPDEYIRKQTMANCERYITEELKVTEKDILNASDRLNELEYTLYLELKEDLKKEIKRLQKVANHIAYIDVMSSFTKITIENHLTRPTFNANEINIESSWHPIVKKMNPKFIENDIKLDDSEQIMLITGPNMAGKSTYMRQTVLTVLMAQMGCYVPATYANIKIFDRIYTRIGASDDLANGKSTFMVEMAETAEALNNATENSLLIFDELGRGTSTYDGVALAEAILEYIHNKLKVKTLFSTHYHELVDLEEKLDGLKNVHVRAEKVDGKLKFYHKVSPGGVEKSYGIEVAKLAKLPKEVTDNSNIIIEALEANHNSVEKELAIPKQVGSNPIILNQTDEKIQYGLFKTEENVSEKKSKEKIEKPTDDQLKKIKEIKNLNVSNMTPIEALVYLNKIKEEL